MDLRHLAINQESRLDSLGNRARSHEPIKALVRELVDQFRDQMPRPTQTGRLPVARVSQDTYLKIVDSFSYDLADSMMLGVQWSIDHAHLKEDQVYLSFFRSFVETRAGEDRLKRALLDRMAAGYRPIAEDLYNRYSHSFNRAAIDLARRAIRDGWSEEMYLARLNRISKLWGIDGLQSHQYATTLRTMQSQTFNAGVWGTFSRAPTKYLYPFMAYVTMRDDRVRPAHRCLDGLVLPSDSQQWFLYTPPLGWNCRCRLVPIHVEIARKAGYPYRQEKVGGEWWPRGARARVECFWDRGGPDRWFPRDAFVTVLAGGLGL